MILCTYPHTCRCIAMGDDLLPKSQCPVISSNHEGELDHHHIHIYTYTLVCLPPLSLPLSSHLLYISARQVMISSYTYYHSHPPIDADVWVYTTNFWLLHRNIHFEILYPRYWRHIARHIDILSASIYLYINIYYTYVCAELAYNIQFIYTRKFAFRSLWCRYQMLTLVTFNRRHE